MGKIKTINSNDLIELANGIGEFIYANGISLHRTCFSVSEFELKCLIGDYLFKKYNLIDSSDYFSAKYDTGMKYVSCTKCGGNKTRLAEAESLNGRIYDDEFALTLNDGILIYRHDDWYCIGCYRNMPKQEIEKQETKGKKRTFTEGYIYFLSDGNGYIKIGKTVDVGKRIDGIGMKMPKQPVLLHSVHVKDYSAAETIFHEHYKEYRQQGEWFKLPKTEIEAIQHCSYPNGINELLIGADNESQ